MTSTFNKQLSFLLYTSLVVGVCFFGMHAFAQTASPSRSILTNEEKQGILNRADAVSNQFSIVILKMDDIIVRFDAHLGKLEGANVDTYAAKAKLDEAKRELESARSVFSMLASAEAAIESESPREKFAILRARYMIIRDSLNETRALLTEAITLTHEAMQRAETEKKMTDAFQKVSPIQ